MIAARQTHDEMLKFVARALSDESKTLIEHDAHWLRQSSVWLRQSYRVLSGVAESESDPEKAGVIYTAIAQMMTAAFDAGVFGGVSNSAAKYVKGIAPAKARADRANSPKEVALIEAIKSVRGISPCEHPYAEAARISEDVNRLLKDNGGFKSRSEKAIALKLQKLFPF